MKQIIYESQNLKAQIIAGYILILFSSAVLIVITYFNLGSKNEIGQNDILGILGTLILIILGLLLSFGKGYYFQKGNLLKWEAKCFGIRLFGRTFANMDLFTQVKIKKSMAVVRGMSITNFTVSLKSDDHYIEVFKHIDFQEVKNFGDKLSQAFGKELIQDL